MNRIPFVIALLLAACGEPPADPFPPQLLANLDIVLDDERYAEVLYASLAEAHPDFEEFQRAVAGEASHSAQLEELYGEHDLALPPEAQADVPAYPALQDACLAAIRQEEGNLALYNVLLDQWAAELPEDFSTILTSFRDETQQTHLPRFRRCAESGAPDATPPA